jgi:hypothetical protein
MSLRDQRSVIDIFCVYGPTYADFIHSYLIPAIARQTRICPRLHLVNFAGPQALFRPAPKNARLRIRDWSEHRTQEQIGFGEGINLLYNLVNPPRHFIVINPDCIPDPRCLFTLLSTLEANDAAMVEARQWPNEHPKKYDPETLETPWCSGALFAMSSLFFRRVGGFDKLFFLYAEDVDLSWRVRNKGGKILYAPSALTAHFTGMYKYRVSRFYYEHFYSSRNCFLLGFKYWGEPGERLVKLFFDEVDFPRSFKNFVLAQYDKIKPAIIRYDLGPPNRWIKIAGFNQYHDIRSMAK